MKADIYWQTYGLENPNSGVFYYAQQLKTALASRHIFPKMVGTERFRPAFTEYEMQECPASFFTRLAPKIFEPMASLRCLRHQESTAAKIFHGLANCNIPIMSQMKSSGWHYVLTIHDLIPIVAPEMVAKTWALQAKILIPRAARLADAIVCVSENTKESIIRELGIAAQKIFVIPIAMDAASVGLGQNSEKQEIIRTLTVARDEEYKRLDLVADVAAAGGGKIIATLVANSSGSTRLRAKYPHLIKDGRLKVFSELPAQQLETLYASCDVSLSPSLYEGFGIPMAKALAKAKPNVVCENTGSSQFLNHQTAIFMKRDASAAEWCEGIYAANNLVNSDSWQKNVNSHLESLPKIDEIADKYLAVYQSLLA